MIRVGLTGGIGSGKSTVARCFLEFGIPVYYADDEAKKLMHSSKVIRKRLVSEFGEAVYEKNELNRQYLASLIFNNPEKLKTINSIVHPEVRNHFKKWIKKQDAPYVIQENAILLENDFRTQFDCIIL
ncbi:MAG: dephospho-CoA kinase, partial [Flavobacteriaceae bacterium]|nr:dephospho-CoA kinase [Flavobacteriaceae bacterium]